MAFSGTQTTRLGASGISRGLYGSFAGKTEVAVIAGDTVPFIGVLSLNQDADGVLVINHTSAGVFDVQSMEGVLG